MPPAPKEPTYLARGGSPWKEGNKVAGHERAIHNAIAPQSLPGLAKDLAPLEPHKGVDKHHSNRLFTHPYTSSRRLNTTIVELLGGSNMIGS